METKVKSSKKGEGKQAKDLNDIEMNYKLIKEYMLAKLQRELPPGLYYHGYHHTLDVLQACQDIARLEGLTENQVMLVKTAALFHDAGFIQTYQGHEMAGSKMAKETLPRFGYGQDDINLICGMIMATKMPQSPKNLYERIICDADLDYLGREDFYPISDSLKRELERKGTKYKEEEWNDMQIDFLKEHKYFTQTSKILRESAKKERIVELIKSTP